MEAIFAKAFSLESKIIVDFAPTYVSRIIFNQKKMLKKLSISIFVRMAVCSPILIFVFFPE